MSLRTAAFLLKRSRPSNQLINLECCGYRFCTMSLNGQSGEVSNARKSVTDFDTSKAIRIDHCPSSAIISWSIDEYDGNTNVPSQEVLDMERVMTGSFQNTLTTRPFFVLDGEGRRMALLSLR
mmetsp:Transcript_18986/g.52953  ORF Transcript_18986/g.52953 Transcript_18986/m.52953 type:complete len:123 (-) Transcript_18986:2783-3151(-)